MQDIYCTFITTRIVQVYLHKHVYVKNGSPVKDVGYENSLVNRIKKTQFYS